MKKNKIVLFFLLISIFFSLPTFAEKNKYEQFTLWGNGDVFQCNPVLDSVLFGSGALIYGTDLVLDKGFKINKKVFDGNILDKNNVNPVDRFFMRPYSKPLDTTADIFMITALASPAILLATENPSDWMTIGMMYAESVLLAQGVKEILKLFINRPRPYMYFEGYPEKDVYKDLDWNNSCPSGHSTMAFMSATFFSYVFCKYNSESRWRVPVVIGSYALATAVATLRIASGNHFLTDVLLGAAIGTGIGFLVPFLHTIIANNDNRGGTSNGNRTAFYMEGIPLPLGQRDVQVGVSPFGINCSMRF